MQKTVEEQRCQADGFRLKATRLEKDNKQLQKEQDHFRADLERSSVPTPLSADRLLQPAEHGDTDDERQENQRKADALVRCCIGVGTQHILGLLFRVCEAYGFENAYNIPHAKKRNLHWKDAIVFTLTYYRLDLPLMILSSILFPAMKSESTASDVIGDVTLLLVLILSDFNLRRSSAQHEIFKSDPEFPELRNVFEVLDSFSINIDQLRDSPLLNQALNNIYYKGMVFKGLVSLDKSLLLKYKSALYSGSTTDPELTDVGKFWKQVEPGTVILADKGFTCLESSNAAGVTLITPCFKSGTYLSPNQLKKSKAVTKPRKEIERLINRARRFRILDHITVKMFPRIDEIVGLIFLISSLFNTELLISKEEEDDDYIPKESDEESNDSDEEEYYSCDENGIVSDEEEISLERVVIVE